MTPTVTTVDSPLHVAWAQIRGIERPLATLLVLFLMVPWLLIVAATDSAVNQLGTFFFLHFLVSSLLSGDRRIYRALGLNRRGALRQQLVISLPVLIVAGMLSLPGLSGADWLWVPVLALAALAVDLVATLWAVDNERRGGVPSLDMAWVGPAKVGSVATRVLRVPMLRWAVPAGIATGFVLAFSEGRQDSFAWSLLTGTCFLGAVLGPAFEVSSGTASLATWQSLGLPRRAWSRRVIPVAVLAPVLALLVALAVLGVLALWETATWELVRQVVSAAPGLGMLWAGVGLFVVSLAGSNGVVGGAAVGATSPLLLIFSLNVIRESTTFDVLLAAAVGGALLVIGACLQHRLAYAANGARATLDTRKFAQ